MSIPHNGDVVLGPDGEPLVISGPGDKRALIYGVVTAEVVLVTVVVALRFVSRRLGRISYWWDDWLILPAYIGFVLSMSVVYWWIRHAYFGVHIGPVTLEKLSEIYRANFIASAPFAVILCTTKLSILAFYWRVFGKGGSVLRWIIRILMVVVVAWAVMNILLQDLQCIPTRGVWDKSIQADCSFDTKLANLVVALVNTVTDVILLALPVGVCLRVHRAWSTRLVLSGIFALGFVTTVFSILRITVIIPVNVSDPLVAYDLFNWQLVGYILLTISESTCLIITACLPTLRPVLVRIWSKMPPHSPDQDKNLEAKVEPRAEGQAQISHHSSPWSDRLWGVEASQAEGSDAANPSSRVSTEHHADHNLERQIMREASDWSLNPEQRQ